MKQPHRRYVNAQRVRCPRCAGTRLQTYRSTRHPDGALSRHTRCRACGAKFIVVWE